MKKYKQQKVSTKQITDFSRQLCTLINASIPILSAFNIIEQSCDHQGMRAVIQKIKNDLKSGNTLATAFKNKSPHFDNLFCNLINIGEESGTLDLIFQHIANYQEKAAELRRKVKKALLYPTVVVVIATTVFIILLVVVIPQFENLYQSFGAKLPFYTQTVIDLAKIIKNYGVLFVAFIGTSIIIFRNFYRRNLRLMLACDNLTIKTPIFGSLIQKAIMARFARILAITFAAGLSLRKSLYAIANLVENSIYKEAIIQIRDNVSVGQAISTAIDHTNLFPKRMVQMIAIGEESGLLENMLIKIAEHYESEVNYFIDNLHNMLEPLIMVILGVLIGGLLIAVYLPVFKLGTVI